MTQNRTPIFVETPKIGLGQVSTANTNRDGTGTIATIFTAGSNGSRVNRVITKAVGTTTAGMVRLYIHDGANARLWKEVSVTAITPSATVESFKNEIYMPGELALVLPTGYSIRASTHNAETFNIIAEGGDY
jgi:hypothetical protein